MSNKLMQAYQLLHEGILALSKAEEVGFRVDLDYINTTVDKLDNDLIQLEKSFKETKFYKHWCHSFGRQVNMNSDTQLRYFLYHVKRLKPPKLTENGEGSTDEYSLKALNIPELNQLVEIRKLKKIKDYLERFKREAVDGIIHPIFNLHLVKTYRSSSSNPNLQNVPSKDAFASDICRKALYPRKGHMLMEMDFKSIEVSIGACYHKDPEMIKYLKNPKSDMHADVSKEIFLLDKFDKSIPSHSILRRATKNGFVFPQFYGDYYKNCAKILCEWIKLPQSKWQRSEGMELDTKSFTIADHLISKGINSYSLFEKHIEKIERNFWGNRFSVYREWKERNWNLYLKRGYIEFYTGFRCNGPMSFNDVNNYPIQGTSFHCLLWVFIQMDKIITENHLDTRLIGQIHDSIILDVRPEEKDYIKKVLRELSCERLPSHWDWIIVPLDVEIQEFPIDGSWSVKNS